MKKLLSLFLSLALVCALAGCGGAPAGGSVDGASEEIAAWIDGLGLA